MPFLPTRLTFFIFGAALVFMRPAAPSAAEIGPWKAAILESLPRLAQDEARRLPDPHSPVQIPAVGEMARQLAAKAVAREIARDPEIREAWLKHQDRLIEPLAAALRSHAIPEGASARDESAAAAIAAHAQRFNALAQAVPAAVWMAGKIPLDRAQELAEGLRSTSEDQRLYLTEANRELADKARAAVEKSVAEVSRLGLREAREIARSLQESLRSAGLADPGIEWRTDQAVDMANWLGGPAAPLPGDPKLREVAASVWDFFADAGYRRFYGESGYDIRNARGETVVWISRLGVEKDAVLIGFLRGEPFPKGLAERLARKGVSLRAFKSAPNASLRYYLAKF